MAMELQAYTCEARNAEYQALASLELAGHGLHKLNVKGKEGCLESHHKSVSWASTGVVIIDQS